MSNQIRAISQRANYINEEDLSKSKLILQHSHESAKSLLSAFEIVRRNRGARGGTTDSEQDLLRAMLVLTAAGLDSMTKQIIRDTLPELAEIDIKVEKGIETFVARQLRGDPNSSETTNSNRFLARLIIAKSRRDQAIQEYIDELTGGSLQSPEELIRAAFALGLEPYECGIDPDTLRPIFQVRNIIIHELDIALNAPRRNRNYRSKANMVQNANILLEIGEKILVGVNNKIHNSV